MKKILLIRTDKIGDVVLTTPVVQIIRKRFPHAHIAFMTGIYTQELIQGNPYLNEVIVYDKHKKHKNYLQTFKFALRLKNKNFDAAIVFNPSHRNHWICWLAHIPKRIGYNKKHGFLLTHAYPDKKGEGLKSESFYNEDLLTELNIAPAYSKELYAAVTPRAENKIDELIKKNGIHFPFVAINVSAGCASRKWPLKNFSLLSHLIYKKLHLDVTLIGNFKECQEVQKYAKIPLWILAETLSLSELTSFLKKAFLHISSDTGPMHIASAIGTPVITIFGRSLPGLGPKRWMALKGNNTFFHKDIGCNPCLAHACQLDFDCLKATKVEEVFYVVKQYTENSHC